jgi:Cytochrome c554 and c-prime
MRINLLVVLLYGTLHAADLKCGTCHTAEWQQQKQSAMAQALATPGDNALFKKHPTLESRKGAYTYTLETKGPDTTYTVSDGTQSLSAPVHWSFGLDNQTFVFEFQNNWYEGLVSYFSEVDRLDTTIGDTGLHPATLLEALGRPVDDAERQACFGCHSSHGEQNGSLNLTTLTPGITCDRCHAGALDHQAAALKGSAAHTPTKLGAQTADQISTFCGQCHRTWETVMRMPAIGVSDVRFQPYRLANSKCYIGGDPRISCVACHNPHSASLPTAAETTSKCLACHSDAKTAKTCPISQTNCASCHMPKVQLPGGHKLFTDHDIRIARQGDPYPY